MKTGIQITGVDADKFEKLGKWEASMSLSEAIRRMNGGEEVDMNWIKRMFKAFWNYLFVHEYYDDDGTITDRKGRAR